MQPSKFRWIYPLGIVLTLCTSALGDHPGGGFGGAGAGTIVTMPAATLPRGQSAYTVSMDYINLSRFSDAQLESIGQLGEEVDSADYTAGVFVTGAWGITDDLTFAVRLPYLFMNDIREPEDEMGMIEVENEGDSAGHGDIISLAQWRLWRSETTQMEAALIGGLKVPSGFTSDASREGEIFELEHQPGSGSWDPLVGVAVSKNWDRLSMHSNVLHRFATKGKQNTNLGDVLNYNLGFAYRLGCLCDYHHHHDHGHDHDHEDHHRHRSLDLIFEFNGLWSESQEVAGVRDENSGGNIIYVSPGARFNFANGHSIFASTLFPMAQDMNGYEHEVDFRVIFGASLVH